MFDFNDFLKLPPKKLMREEVFKNYPNSPIVIEWWKKHPVYELHKHIDFKEFAIVRHGFCIHHHRGLFDLLTLGDVAFIGNSTPHGYVCTHEMSLFNIVFHEEYLIDNLFQIKGLLNELRQLSQNDAHLTISSQTLRQVLSTSYILEQESFKYDDLTFMSMLSSFIRIALMMLEDNNSEYYLHNNIANYSRTEIKLDTLLKAIKLIRKNIKQPIKNIVELLNAQNYNNKTMQRYFKKHLCISIHQFILLQKLVLTMNYIIKYPDMSLTSIMEEVGYSNYKNFSRNIHFFFNISPKEFYRNVLEVDKLGKKLDM
ncbi:helix-turn-helix transcriptional regulator [Pasteurella skyensis]|uniref:Helix-turn-helix transcriptional regulator n=1 Tax=Phocoenobacter skyensis TaxID=97481 RepID=A0AAJ6N7V6_9PAST|nr:helix-turn-helix domain-containing protein [Pasteurella skyensis]MDP8161645.1 helix-turn-helix transcriptional regulator [Pasteurella skyensis]MDP8171801.1 helix-turn-helix transcriptional regulator [Pasteurella skyensis]MDP8176039.1 helix-turn-helix transcriptional regulator [Pasteurella skyensis]MDP8178007.1 helix-turn-helix transcriptional regulator [Pasteurella skyensis]MDP8182334.1 helix-turn-helix transcriptional regulator [Pasteurella skyensis]